MSEESKLYTIGLITTILLGFILGVYITTIETEYPLSLQYYLQNYKELSNLVFKSLPYCFISAFTLAFAFEFSGIGRNYDDY